MPFDSLAVESYARLALWQCDLAQQQFAECTMVMPETHCIENSND